MSGFAAAEFEACSTPEATACSAVQAWQQERMSSDEVVEAILDATGGDETETRRLMQFAAEWYERLVKLARDSRRDPSPWEPHLSRENRERTQ